MVAFMRTKCLCISVFGVATGPRVKSWLAVKVLQTRRRFYSTDRSKPVVPVLVLLYVALWFIQRADLFYVLLVVFCSCVVQIF